MSKKITQSQQTGRTGEVFVGFLFQRLGQIWHESRSDAGIDCHVEWRDIATGIATNRHIGVLVKAYSGAFPAETEASFEFIPTEDDISYWLSGTMPVILVCCKPWADQAYWVDIREQFADPERRRSRKIVFDKTRAKVDEAALPFLEKLALPETVGLYLGAPPKRETLFLNFVRVTKLPKQVFIGNAKLWKRKQVFARLRDNGAEQPAGEFICRDRSIIAVRDLRKQPWQHVVDPGSVEGTSFREWWTSDNCKRRSFAVELLNHCLTAFFQNKGVRWRASDEVYYFKSNRGQREMTVKTHGLHREETSHTVFKTYFRRNSTDIAFCRHHAIRARFHEFGREWFLELSPTYRFTRDGWNDDRYAAERLKKIKDYEGNPGVFGNALMWADFMTSTVSDLWHPAYEYLAFGGMITFETSRGIPDSAWRDSALETKTVEEQKWQSLLDL